MDLYARYAYLALRVRRDAVPAALHAEYKQLRAILDADTMVAQPDPATAAVKLMMSGEYGKIGADPLDRIAMIEKRRAALSDPAIEYGRKWSQYHHALQAAYEGGDLVPADTTEYNVGPETMAKVFKPAALTNMHNTQAVLDAVEAALTTAAVKLVMSDNGDRIAMVEKRRVEAYDYRPTTQLTHDQRWSQYHHALQAAYEGGDLVPKPRRKLASAGQVFDHPECVGCGYGVICDVYDDMDEIYSYFTPIGGLDRLTEYQRWPEWLVAQIERDFDPKTNRVVTRLLKPHELAILKAGKSWIAMGPDGDWYTIVGDPFWLHNVIYRTV